MNILFTIRPQSKNKNKPVTIWARLRDGAAIDLTAKTGITIAPADWSKAKGKPILRSDNKSDQLNDELHEIKKNLRKSYTKQPDKLNLTSAWLSTEIDKIRFPEKYEEKKLTFFQFIQKFIDESATAPNWQTGKVVNYRQRRLYAQTYNRLTEFCDIYRDGKELTFQDIDLDFYHDFTEYLQSLNLATNTIGKRIQTVKIFLNAAVEKGYQVNPAYKSKRFKVISEETESIYLNEKELQMIYEYDFAYSPKLDRVRDLFIIMCWTGLRIGDASKLSMKNIDGDFIDVMQSKTESPVVIPLHHTIKAIIKKHGGELPKTISDQKFRAYLKEVAKIAGIKGNETKSITKGGMKVTQNFDKWELVQPHTGRRSFATNLYKAGFPTLSIMKITGHRTEQAFLKYIKVTPREHAEKLKQFWLNQGNHLKAI